MPNKQFFKLSVEKRKTIIQAAMKEFCDHGFEHASTNRIVKSAGIAKGSLFKYFGSKKELFFFLINRVVQRLSEEMPSLPDDLFEKVKAYAVFEFDFYCHHPLEFRFLKKIFFNENVLVRKMIFERYEGISEDFFHDLFDTSAFDTERKQVVIDILKWVLKGINDEFVRSHDMEDANKAKEQYLWKLEQYLSVLEPLKEVFDEIDQ